jgi:LuxR family transcriptional regulator, quorum-sensing system regulator SolR
MTVKLLSDTYAALISAESSADLHVVMGKFASEMGFENFAYALTITAPSLKQQHYFLTNYPNEWVERYVARRYFEVDPLVGHAESSTLPAIWSDGFFQGAKVEEFWEEARAYGLQAGLSFSVHEQPGVTGIFSLSRDKIIDLQGHDLAALIGRAQMFASLLHHAVSRIDLPKLLPESNVSLTARERECLKWAAEGKTAWEIGQIVGITERTIVFHLNNVIQKLGASNKVQAIVRAIALRLI